MEPFSGPRYLTRGINAEISLSLQILMWGMIDEDLGNGLAIDYLQVFDLKPVTVNGITLQQIEHRQELPPRRRNIVVNTGEVPISAKIFVIDSGEYATMLFASEY